MRRGLDVVESITTFREDFSSHSRTPFRRFIGLDEVFVCFPPVPLSSRFNCFSNHFSFIV